MRGKTITLSKRSIKRLAVTLLLLPILSAYGYGGDYTIIANTIDGGGGVSSGGPYTLIATIGQPDAAYSAGGQYELLGGFWPGGPLCIVDFEHFARFAEHWLETDCSELNDWCSGADLNYLGDVDLIDFGLFVNEWLYYCPYDWPLK